MMHLHGEERDWRAITAPLCFCLYKSMDSANGGYFHNQLDLQVK
jgi:hypothetical protein